jgi:alpha-ketoglutarate-dependent taurine dioxygenase
LVRGNVTEHTGQRGPHDGVSEELALELLQQLQIPSQFATVGGWIGSESADQQSDDKFAARLRATVNRRTGGAREFGDAVNVHGPVAYAAYEDLPDDDKEAIADLRVVHSAERSQYYVRPEMSYEEIAFWQKSFTKSCPMVWTHQSGRKSLLLGATADYVIGLPVEESRALLARLRDWATQPRYVYRHEWQLGDLLMWDNTGTMHRALPYAVDSGRLMHRTVLAGEEPLN